MILRHFSRSREVVSLVHPCAGLGRSSEACHIIRHHCWLSLGKRETVSRGDSCSVWGGAGRGGAKT